MEAKQQEIGMKTSREPELLFNETSLVQLKWFSGLLSKVVGL